ncbi:MAG TPA: hypothetical protein VHA11_03110, partial [Bryobacteraceae bacterium]|nr:hypothetical protein [Bryobacteraceae bacterium]
RVSPKGEGFVLYQAGKREITAVAVAKNGAIYAAGVGNKTGASALSSAGVLRTAAEPAPALGASPATPSAPGGQITTRPAPAPAAPIVPAAPPAIAGGSEIYRIDKDGYPRRIWSHSQQIVYALGFDQEQRPLAGTGNKGIIYRLDSDLVYTELLNAPPTQVTALYSGASGRIYAGTGNVGKVYQIGPGIEKSGTLESDVLDAGMFSYWGRLSFRGTLNGGRVSVATRSGNLDRPQNDWSRWSEEIASSDGARVSSPAARFLQWRVSMQASESGVSPELRGVDVAYLSKNVAPAVQQIEITPPNYRFPPQVQLTLGAPPPLSLPPLGRGNRVPAPKPAGEPASATMQYAKGFIGARWAASDENGDSLVYTLQIKGEGETQWKPLNEKLSDRHLSWDSTSFPDGEYRLRVIASDSPENPPDQALMGELTSDAFTIDNTPPAISGLAATAQGSKVEVRWKTADALSLIEKAEYSVNGGEWTAVDPVTKLTDSREEEYAVTFDRPSAGELTIAVRVDDEFDNQVVAKTVIK